MKTFEVYFVRHGQTFQPLQSDARLVRLTFN